MMTLKEFHNGLRLLYSIDAHELENPTWYRDFADDPFKYFIRGSDADAAAIWAVMVLRGAVKGPTAEQIGWVLCCGKSEHCNAADHCLDHGLSPAGYAARNCEGAEIQKQASAVMRLLEGNLEIFE